MSVFVPEYLVSVPGAKLQANSAVTDEREHRQFALTQKDPVESTDIGHNELLQPDMWSSRARPRIPIDKDKVE